VFRMSATVERISGSHMPVKQRDRHGVAMVVRKRRNTTGQSAFVASLIETSSFHSSHF